MKLTEIIGVENLSMVESKEVKEHVENFKERLPNVKRLQVKVTKKSKGSYSVDVSMILRNNDIVNVGDSAFTLNRAIEKAFTNSLLKIEQNIKKEEELLDLFS